MSGFNVKGGKMFALKCIYSICTIKQSCYATVPYIREITTIELLLLLILNNSANVAQ